MVTCPKWLFFFPAFIFFILSAVSAYDLSNLLNTKVSLLLFERFSSTIVYFLLGFQIFMFGLFSSLIATKLQMQKPKNINIFFKIFKIRYAFLISSFLITLILLDSFFFDVYLLNDHIQKIIYPFIIFFSILLIINSLFVSLITIEDQK